MHRVILGIVLAALASACSSDGGPKTPTGPSQPANSTRVISVSGNLDFGEVAIGQSRELTFTITNSGGATLTVTGMTVSGGLADHVAASWTNGTIAAGSSQTVRVRFEPSRAGSYSGTVTVNGDQTSGSNTVPISGTARAGAEGVWRGSYVVERCEGTGSTQDLLCSANRGIFPVGTPLPISISLNQNGTTVNGTVSFGQVTGPVSGTISPDGFVTLQGTATSGVLSAQISSWSTRVQGDSMVGNISYNVTGAGVPGVGVLVTRLSGVTRQ